MISLTMPLLDIPLPVDESPIPGDVQRFVDDAESRVRDLMDARADLPLPGFVPSDFASVYRGLRAMTEHHLAPGDAFLEWGSGYGVVAMLASLLDYDAAGIEVHRELIDAAESLAEEYELPTVFIHGSFIPDDHQAVADIATDFEVIDTDAPAAYGELGRAIDDFDVIFAFPWPGEEQTITQLFAATAAEGALLMTYHGLDDLRLRRKVAPD